MPSGIPWTQIGIGGAASVATLFVVGYFLGKAGKGVWSALRPYVERVVGKVVETLDIHQEHIHRAEHIAKNQTTLCEKHVDSMKWSRYQLESLLHLGIEGCQALRILAQQWDDPMKSQLLQNIDQAEKIARQAVENKPQEQSKDKT